MSDKWDSVNSYVLPNHTVKLICIFKECQLEYKKVWSEYKFLMWNSDGMKYKTLIEHLYTYKQIILKETKD